MKLGIAISEVAAAEAELSEGLLELGERHKADHDVYRLTRQLARWAQGHVAALEPFADRYGGEVEPVDSNSGGPLTAIHEEARSCSAAGPSPPCCCSATCGTSTCGPPARRSAGPSSPRPPKRRATESCSSASACAIPRH
jgi:hypothetical protein